MYDRKKFIRPKMSRMCLFLVGMTSQCIGKALDDGGPSEQLKRRFSIDSTLPSSQQDSQDNARLDSQCSCVDDEHISPTPPSHVLALTWHYYMWLHVAYDV